MTNNIFAEMFYWIWAPISAAVAFHFIGTTWAFESFSDLFFAVLAAIVCGMVIGDVIAIVCGTAVKKVVA